MASKKHLEWALPVGAILKSPKLTYKVESVLGTGGFGITYKVSADVKLGNIPVHTFFAIKEHYLSDCCERTSATHVNISRTASDKYAESFEDFKAEANRLNALSGKHKGIVRVNEVFQANNTVYYVMEYLNGTNIRSVVNASGPYSESNALNIIREVGDAVAFLHTQQITHLDIKPDNIMLHTYSGDEEAYPVLIDFGLAKHYDNRGKPTSTVRLQGCSDGYSPVEQYVRINEFSPFADVYALAATLFFMLTGKDPVIATDISRDYIMENLPADISDRTKDAIVEAMRKDKKDRTQTVKQFLANLDAPYTLPFGYKLETNNGTFLLTSVVNTLPDRIVYCARKSNGNTTLAQQGNLTQTTEYLVTEFYSKAYCERSPQGGVTIAGNHQDDITRFQSEQQKELGTNEWGVCKRDKKGGFLCETLEANGTFYSIQLAKRSANYKKYIWWGAAALCLILGFCVPQLFGGCSEDNDPVVMEDIQAETAKSITPEMMEVVDSTAMEREEKAAKLNKYLADVEAWCDTAELNGVKSPYTVTMVSNAHHFYYYWAGTLYKDLNGTDIERNSRVDSLVQLTYDYWLNEGNRLSNSWRNFERKKTYYERANRLRPSQTLQDRIKWLEDQLNRYKK